MSSLGINIKASINIDGMNEDRKKELTCELEEIALLVMTLLILEEASPEEIKERILNQRTTFYPYYYPYYYPSYPYPYYPKWTTGITTGTTDGIKGPFVGTSIGVVHE